MDMMAEEMTKKKQREIMRDTLGEMGIRCTEQDSRRLMEYMRLVLEKNQHINLTSITDPNEFILKHFLDSAAVMNLPEYRAADTVLDLGTGGGFPGVPLAILTPGKQFTLIDSLQKRVRVVEEMCGEIALTNVNLRHGRAEDLGRDPRYREQFDLCLSRAVANMAVLAEYCLPFVKTGGYFVSYKGSDIEEELSAAKKAIRVLGGRIAGVEAVNTKGLGHNFVIIRKETSTPARYPRQAGKPKKTPIR